MSLAHTSPKSPVGSIFIYTVTLYLNISIRSTFHKSYIFLQHLFLGFWRANLPDHLPSIAGAAATSAPRKFWSSHIENIEVAVQEAPPEGRPGEASGSTGWRRWVLDQATSFD